MSNIQLKKVLLYLLGIFVTGFGVVLLIRSTYGAGAWDAVNEHNSIILGITLGTSSLVTNLTILSIIIIGNKKLKYLLTLIPIFGIALSMDLWDLVIFDYIKINSLPMYITSLILGILILPLGLSFMISTGYPSMVYDELTLLLMKLLKVKSFLYVRWGVELFAIVLGITLGYIAGVGFGSIHVGSLVIALTIGPLITFYLNLLKKKTDAK
jgi:uncharacterized membrane protein YczE